MSRRPSSTPPSRRLERRAERQARQPGAAPAPRRQRANRKAPTKTAGRNINWLPILAGLGGVALIAILAYAVIGASSGSGDELPGWRKAELDSSSLLPGTYYPPHPGPDGIAGTSDDRQHFANGTVMNICTQEQIDSGNISDPICYTSNPPTSGPHNQSPTQFKVLENPAPKENLIHSMEHGGVVIWVNTNNADVIKQLEDITNDENDRRRPVVMSRYTDMEPDTIALTAWTRLEKFTSGEFTKKRVTDFIEEHSKRFNPEGF